MPDALLNKYTKRKEKTMRRFQKFFAGALSVSLIAASMLGCGAFAEETETETAANAETAAETVGESTGTRTIVDHTGAEVVLPTEIKRVVISSILPLPSVYCLFRGSADDLVGIHPSSTCIRKSQTWIPAL